MVPSCSGNWNQRRWNYLSTVSPLLLCTGIHFRLFSSSNGRPGAHSRRRRCRLESIERRNRVTSCGNLITDLFRTWAMSQGIFNRLALSFRFANLNSFCLRQHPTSASLKSPTSVNKIDNFRSTMENHLMTWSVNISPSDFIVNPNNSFNSIRFTREPFYSAKIFCCTIIFGLLFHLFSFYNHNY